MQQWTSELSTVFSGIAAIAAIAGMFWHRIQSAKDAGRLEQKVDNMTDEIGRQRVAVGECQLAATCDRQMTAMTDRIASAHRRMDGHETRINGLDTIVSELRGKVEAVAARQS